RGLGVLRRATLNFEVGLPHPQDESLGSFEAAVEIKRADQRLHHVADDIVAFAGTVLARLLAKANEGRNSNFAAVFRARRAVDQAVVALREVAFGFLEITLVQSSRDDEAEDPVTEEFEARVTVIARDALVRQCQLEQADVLRLMAKLAANERRDVPGQFWLPV